MALPPNQKHSLVAALASMAESCLSMRDLKQIHARAILSNLHRHPLVLGKIFRFAAVSPSGDLHYADRLFSQMAEPNTFFYNILIRGYSRSSWLSHSVHLFNQMRLNCVDPDEFTLTFLLKARSRMKMDEPLTMASDEIHGAVLKFGFYSQLFVYNALIHYYAARGESSAARRVFAETSAVDVISWSGLVVAHVRAGELEYARHMFDQMPERDVVSWTTMISGYSQAKHSREALHLFSEMLDASMMPDEVTMLSVVSACTNLGDLETGIGIHQYIDERGLGWMVSLQNALINMYSKCGCVDRAWQVFDNMNRKSLVTWNSMISASANHGNPDDAFRLFECMISSGISPDGFTLLALLVAYTHKGLVDEGYRLFESMQRDHGIEARIEHYGCVVDMLGKAGRLDEAYKLLTSIPLPSNCVLWETLLAACKVYGNVNMGERVVKRLQELKPDGGKYYAILREISDAAAGRKELEQTTPVNDVNSGL
ncbi:Tetratricopeptide-like helical domain containing protein [Trema orientale]|uniref:Tetratricopeptide-like helical domain containing protein n=1 Tax=Trema orientale TaxID=63057 RepID=A0A2P5FF10_TREOI|nr:Tetratricopeptide-like helical domain containing protein [Trema orientale]